MSITEKFISWCQDDSATARFQRSIAQGAVGVIITVLPQALSQVYLPEWATGAIVALTMAFLAPIQKSIGDLEDNKEIDNDKSK